MVDVVISDARNQNHEIIYEDLNAGAEEYLIPIYSLSTS